MWQRCCCLEAVLYISIATIQVSYAYYNEDFSGDKKLKHIVLEYGDVLTSYENGENYIKADTKSKHLVKFIYRAPNKRLSDKILPSPPLSSTRCTTDGAITLDPMFDPSSSENKKDSAENRDGELVDAETTTQTSKVYKSPPEAKKPDHYIDDP